MADDLRKKILLIDDDPMVIRSIEKALELKGYEVAAVTSGDEGLLAAEADGFDLVICDVRMPRTDGVTTMEKIQHLYRMRAHDCAYMFITGYAEDDRAQKAAALGIAEFIMKPFDLGRFLDAVQKELALCRKRKETTDRSSEIIPENSSVGKWKYPHDRFTYVRPVLLKQTNLTGNTYFANYIEWQGECRESFLLSHPGFSQWSRFNQHIKMITHSINHRYISETTFGDVLRIELTTREIRLTSLIMRFDFYRSAGGELLGQGWQKVCFMNIDTGKLCPVPKLILDLAEPVQETV